MTLKLIIAAGGTGGHVFPGISVAEAWQESGGSVVFVGTPFGKEAKWVPAAHIPFKSVRAYPLKGQTIRGLFNAVVGLPIAFLSAVRLLVREKPDVVLGMGGYVCVPVCVAAYVLGVPVAVAEQNAVPGLGNRLLSRVTACAFVNFPGAARALRSRRVLVVGNPVRTQIQFQPYQLPQNKITILVCGGSQGAHALNEMAVDLMPLLKRAGIVCELIHQTGERDYEQMKMRHGEHGESVEVHSFIQNMSAVYQRAHLVIARAGATTLAELAMAGRPAILVPFPFAADDHQMANARYVEAAGAAWVVPQSNMSASGMAQLVCELYHNQDRLALAARAMHECARPDAAVQVIRCLRSVCV